MRAAQALALLLAVAVLAGCASTTARPDMGTRVVAKIKTSVIPPPGVLYTDYTAPLVFTPALTRLGVLEPVGASKEGSATAYEIGLPPLPIPGLVMGLDLFAWGDASYETAAKSAGIQEVRAADYHMRSILMVFRRTTIMVYGD